MSAIVTLQRATADQDGLLRDLLELYVEELSEIFPVERRPILNEVSARLDRDVAAGAVHATLVRLEEKGLVSSEIGPGTEVRAGRPRRYYRIDPSGVRALNDAHVAVNTLWRGFRWPLKGHA